jgi:hypothetical protein
MSESQLQALCFQSHWNAYPEERGLLYMNFNNPQNARHGMHLRSLGLVAGVADMTYLHSDGVVFLEFKALKGRQSPLQIEWQARVMSVGCKYAIIKSIEEFYKAIGK